jgi:hypothetical protein
MAHTASILRCLIITQSNKCGNHILQADTNKIGISKSAQIAHRSRLVKACPGWAEGPRTSIVALLIYIQSTIDENLFRLIPLRPVNRNIVIARKDLVIVSDPRLKPVGLSLAVVPFLGLRR